MSSLTQQSGFWDRSAGSKVFSHPLDHERFALEVSADAALLDYGCGHGRLCAELSARGFQNVVGVDYSAEMIAIARREHPGLTFSGVDGYALPFVDARFDAVLLFAVLTCIPSDDAQRMLLVEIFRVLKPGGLLLVSDYPLQSDERNVARYASFADEFDSYGTFRLPNGGVVRHHRDDWFADLLREFRIDHTVSFQATTMNGNPARIVQLWARRVATNAATKERVGECVQRTDEP